MCLNEESISKCCSNTKLSRAGTRFRPSELVKAWKRQLKFSEIASQTPKVTVKDMEGLMREGGIKYGF